MSEPTRDDRLERENESLRQENARLRAALDELRSMEPEEIIRAIRQGEVDALVVEEEGEEQIYSLQTFDSVYRSMVEECFPYGALNRRLPDYCCYWYDVGQNCLFDLKPVPDPAVIAESINDRLRPKRRWV